MKLITGAVLAVLVIIVVIAGLMILKSKTRVDELSAENAKLETVVLERDSMVNEFVAAFDTIETSLAFINEKRSQLVLSDQELSLTQKDAIIKDIKMMNSMLEQSSAKIAELEQKLNRSGAQIRSFKNKIASLSQKLERQNSLITELKVRVEEQNQQLVKANHENENLQNQVLAISDTVQMKDSIIIEQEEKITEQFGLLNKAFFAYGTTKELADNGVIEKEGGFLGIGRSKIISSHFNEDYFTRIDISEQHSIELNARKVNLISEHPDSSYKLIEEDGLITKLEIEAPEDFWKISHYAVIEVKL